VQRLIYGILTDHQVSEFERKRELDFSHGIAKVGRFRSTSTCRGGRSVRHSDSSPVASELPGARPARRDPAIGGRTSGLIW